MMGNSTKSMQSQFKRTETLNPVLRSIDENDDFDFLDSEDSDVFIDPK